MTERQRRTARPRADGVPTEPTPVPAETTTDPGPAVPPAVTPIVIDRLVILDEYAGPDGLLPVVVAVSHDAVFVGQHIRVPVTERVAGLIERGFLEVEFPEPEPGVWR